MKLQKMAFTLIELLIVVAIIAILAAIAVPNFLEANMRAKVGRAKADQRNIAIALESYAVDHNGKYPVHLVCQPTGNSHVGWARGQRMLTTPIAYMTSLIPDVFQLKTDQLTNPPGDVLPKGDFWVGGNPAVDKSYNPIGRDRHVMDYENYEKGMNLTWRTRWELSYGRTMWKLQSFGPMRDVNAWGWAETVNHPGFPDKYYDPSNGTISGGLITRSQSYAK